MQRKAIHRYIYYGLLAILGGCMVTTKGLSNFIMALLAANWVLEGDWKEKWSRIKQSKVLHLIVAYYLLNVVGILWSSHVDYALRIIHRQLPLFVVAVVVLTTPPPKGKWRQYILGIYMGTVFVVSIIGLVRWFVIPNIAYRDMIPYISHIRFSLNCCMVVFICAFVICEGFKKARGGEYGKGFVAWQSAAALLMIVWMALFLVIQRSYTAFAIILVVSCVVILRYRQWKLLGVWSFVVLLVALLLVAGCRSYYDLSPLASSPLQASTANGRLYEHKQDGLIENGNYVNNYICHEELESEWYRRTGYAVDSLLATGYTVESCLIRYLNALGLTKDSVGVVSLTDEQVAEISRGVENPVYEHGGQLKKMLYVMLFEYENYRCYNAVYGFTMLQRLDMWRCGWKVFCQNLWIGTGTGDLRDEMHSIYVAEGSSMQQLYYAPHNMYITLLAMFGLVGGVILLVLSVRAIGSSVTLRTATIESAVVLAWVVLVLVSCITENTPDSHEGALFCAWFLAFRVSKET